MTWHVNWEKNEKIEGLQKEIIEKEEIIKDLLIKGKTNEETVKKREMEIENMEKSMDELNKKLNSYNRCARKAIVEVERLRTTEKKKCDKCNNMLT